MNAVKSYISPNKINTIQDDSTFSALVASHYCETHQVDDFYCETESNNSGIIQKGNIDNI